MKTRLVLIALTVLTATACGPSHPDSKEVLLGTDFQTATPGGQGGMPGDASADKSGSGKVLETMNSGGYTYVKVALGGSPVWVAAQETSVKVGDVVSFAGGTPMQNFRSKTLNRTFDVVYFVGGLQIGGKSSVAVGAPAGAEPMAAPHTRAPASVAVKVEGIKKATGGKTVAETFAERSKLVGKEVIVRGKVVRYNANIMGKNWLHIQDGTGKAGTNDLTVTTDASAAVGNTVVVQGTVVTDKDFGAGYKYDVMLEKAKITME